MNMIKCNNEKCSNEFEAKGSGFYAKKFCCRNCKSKQKFSDKLKDAEYRKEYNKKSSENYHLMKEDPIKYNSFLEKKAIWTINNIDKLRENNRISYQNNTEKCKLESKKRFNKAMKEDPVAKYKHTLRQFLQNAVIKSSTSGRRKRTSKYSEIFGLTLPELKKWIESQFEPWMTWENNGRYTGNLNETWQLDHKIPLSEAKTIEEVNKLSNYTNLRPICSYKNKRAINYDVK